ncbi:transmembrane protein 273 [Xenopus tropicalis]|uniref:Transmembrane protein 273 n=1 Tax=Xenopus tropicalis TaxID=8364 RepID=A0A8J1JYM2_XENTR|nr:transmembrane protein 273 [Xenopus tropicalis]
MGLLASGQLLLLAIFVFYLGPVTADDKNKEEFDVQYAVIGACVGAILAVSFIAVKLYMIKKHMFDNNFSESESLNQRSFRMGDGEPHGSLH